MEAATTDYWYYRQEQSRKKKAGLPLQLPLAGTKVPYRYGYLVAQQEGTSPGTHSGRDELADKHGRAQVPGPGAAQVLVVVREQYQHSNPTTKTWGMPQEETRGNHFLRGTGPPREQALLEMGVWIFLLDLVPCGCMRLL